MSSHLVLEVNFVYFPLSKPSKTKGEAPEPWDQESKRKFYQQEAEIHFIQIGPVEQELLDTKLAHMELTDVEFTWNEAKKSYFWNSGKDLKGALPHKFLLQLMQELKKVGFALPEYSSYPDSHFFENGSKKIWVLEKKF